MLVAAGIAVAVVREDQVTTTSSSVNVALFNVREYQGYVPEE